MCLPSLKALITGTINVLEAIAPNGQLWIHLSAAYTFVFVDYGNAMLVVGDRIDRTTEFTRTF